MKKDNNSKALSVRLDGETINMLQSICILLGIDTPTDAIKTCIKEIYESPNLKEKEKFYKKGFEKQFVTYNQTLEQHCSGLKELAELGASISLDRLEDSYVPNQGDIYTSTFKYMEPFIDFLVAYNKSNFITEMIRLSDYLSNVTLSRDVNKVECEPVIKSTVSSIASKLIQDGLADNEMQAYLNMFQVVSHADKSHQQIEFYVMGGKML